MILDSETSSVEDESYLPEIPDVFNHGTYSAIDLSKSHSSDEFDSYLPYIGRLFEDDTSLQPEHRYQEILSNENTLPMIEGYFEQGIIPANRSRVTSRADPYSPQDKNYFEAGQIEDFSTEATEDVVSPPVPRFGSSSMLDTSSSTALDNYESITVQSTSQANLDQLSQFDLSSVWSSPSFFDVRSSAQTPQVDISSISQSSTLGSQLWADTPLSSSIPQSTEVQTPLSWRFGHWSSSASDSQTADLNFWGQNLFRGLLSGTEPKEETLQSTDDVRYERSRNIEEDLVLMAEKGFIVGTQRMGTILQGYYGEAVRGQLDLSGQAFSASDVGQAFVIKMVESKANDQMNDTKLEMFEIERMGPSIQCSYRNMPTMTFISAQRQYMILESAELGDLEAFLENSQVSEEMCLIVIKDLYNGLKHLHDCYVFHCDIEPRNVLLFQRQGRVVAKWCDFGMSVIMNGEHPSQSSPLQISRINEYRRYDLECLARVFQMLQMYSQLGSQWYEHIEKIINELNSIDDLGEISHMFNY